ncbi:MAG: choice-of-anchor X domain-containing protein, partial [Pseudonocardiaceae bacterium]
IWPLGFGNVDKAQLDRFADGGFQGSCGSNSPSPQAVVVGSSVEVTQQILNAFSAARCAGIGPLDSNQVRPGETIDVTVTIPLIATDGSIIVFKRHPRIGVQYLDPEGTLAPKSGTAKDSTFQVSGENGQVEALRIVNPIPGEWTVRISSPAGVPPLDVGTTVTYQGAVRVSMTTDPPSPQAGQPVAVSLRLATRNRAIVDADILRGFSFSAELSGDGFAPLQVGEFLDNGVGPDVAAGDGVFTGQVTIPATATGALRFVGQVAGVGISGDSREVNTRVVSGASAVRAVAQLPSPDTEVEPGGSIQASAEVTNESGRPRNIRLLLVDPSPGTQISIPDAVHELPSTGNRTIDFTVVVDPGTVLGTNSATLQVVDDADPGVVFYSGPITLVAGYPFPWLPVLGVVALVVAVVAAAIVLWLRRRAGEVRGLVVKLYRGGDELGDLAAPDEPATSFGFVLRLDEHVPELMHAGSADSDAYRVSRPGGVPLVRTPFGQRQSLPLGTRLPVTHELSLELLDENELAKAASEQNGSWSSEKEARDPDDRGLL